MYLTHPVRRIREDPTEGESVTLLVTAVGEDEDVADDLANRLTAHGTVEERLRFGTVKVTVSQVAVDVICQLPDVASVETANTLALDPEGAGEDVDLDDGA